MARYELPAARALQPYQQGAFVGLCGLYSAINAIRLALHPVRPLTGHEARHLFFEGVSVLRATMRLRKALEFGIEEQAWARLLMNLVDEAERLTGVGMERSYLLRAVEADDRGAAVERLGQGLRRGGPVVVYARGVLNHFTVISGVSDQRIVLFDSLGLRWLNRDSCGLDRASGLARHQLSRRSALALLARA